MSVLVLLAFISAVLVALAVGLFAWTVAQRTFDHGEQMSLLPLAEDAACSPALAARADSARGSDPFGPAHPDEPGGTDDEYERRRCHRRPPLP